MGHVLTDRLHHRGVFLQFPKFCLCVVVLFVHRQASRFGLRQRTGSEVPIMTEYTWMDCGTIYPTCAAELPVDIWRCDYTCQHLADHLFSICLTLHLHSFNICNQLIPSFHAYQQWGIDMQTLARWRQSHCGLWCGFQLFVNKPKIIIISFNCEKMTSCISFSDVKKTTFWNSVKLLINASIIIRTLA